MFRARDAQRRFVTRNAEFLSLLAQKPWIVPIPGTTRLHRLEENIGAGDIELSADDLRQFNSAVSSITVQGDRYPAHLQQRVAR